MKVFVFSKPATFNWLEAFVPHLPEPHLFAIISTFKWLLCGSTHESILNQCTFSFICLSWTNCWIKCYFTLIMNTLSRRMGRDKWSIKFVMLDKKKLLFLLQLLFTHFSHSHHWLIMTRFGTLAQGWPTVVGTWFENRKYYGCSGETHTREKGKESSYQWSKQCWNRWQHLGEEIFLLFPRVNGTFSHLAIALSRTDTWIESKLGSDKRRRIASKRSATDRRSRRQ